MKASQIMHSCVLAMLEMDSRTIVEKTGLFERAETTSCFAVCERKIANHCCVRRSASMTVSCRQVRKERESVVRGA